MIVNNLTRFLDGEKRGFDKALSNMALDILTLAKHRVPFRRSGGQLRASGYFVRVAEFLYRLIFNKRYARYQEDGGDGKRVVRNYSTPGTGKGYLKNSVKDVFETAPRYIKNQ